MTKYHYMKFFPLQYPGHLYELGCEWNYRVFQCSAGNKCPAAYDSGISILHGNAMAFISGNAMKLQVGSNLICKYYRS